MKQRKENKTVHKILLVARAVSYDACMVAYSFTGSKQMLKMYIQFFEIVRQQYDHCDAQAKSVVLPLHPLKMPFHVENSIFSSSFFFSIGCADVCLVFFIPLLLLMEVTNVN